MAEQPKVVEQPKASVNLPDTFIKKNSVNVSEQPKLSKKEVALKEREHQKAEFARQKEEARKEKERRKAEYEKQKAEARKERERQKAEYARKKAEAKARKNK